MPKIGTIKIPNTSIRLVKASDIPDIRRLVNLAYKELGDMGLNYTATYQDEKITKERVSEGRAFVLERDGKIVGTVLIKIENKITGKNSAYVGQLAVHPAIKNQGLGSILMDYCENLAVKEGFEAIQLDTAKPATHLVEWYQRRGYKIVGDTRFDGKTYESWIFEKTFT